MSVSQEEPNSEEGCKRGSRPLSQLGSLIDSYWLYFTRRGVLNSDGRRLLARVAREASRGDCRRVAEKIWRVLRDPTLEAITRLLEDLDYDLGRLYDSQYGPRGWRWRSWREK